MVDGGGVGGSGGGGGVCVICVCVCVVLRTFGHYAGAHRASGFGATQSWSLVKNSHEHSQSSISYCVVAKVQT